MTGGIGGASRRRSRRFFWRLFYCEVLADQRTSKLWSFSGWLTFPQRATPTAEPLLSATVLRSDEGRTEEARIKDAAQETKIVYLSNPVGQKSSLLGTTFTQGGNGEFFSVLNPGSTAMNDSSLLLDPGSGNALRLIAFTITAYAGLTAAVFALTPTTLALTHPEHMAVEFTLILQVSTSSTGACE